MTTQPRPGVPDHAVPDDGRDETEAERIDRNLGELLQELRVGAVGVQVLFAFLLAIPFTTKFVDLDGWQQTLFIADLVLAALATALLLAPVAHHRLLFRRHVKASILRDANRFAITGLVTVGLAISGSVLLVVTFVDQSPAVWVVAACTTLAIFGLWFVFPLSHRRRDDY